MLGKKLRLCSSVSFGSYSQTVPQEARIRVGLPIFVSFTSLICIQHCLYQQETAVLTHYFATVILLGNDSETNNETTAIVTQQLRKYTTIREQLLGSGPHSTTAVLLEAVFSKLSAQRLY
jgi:hypothetical protein